MFNVDHKTILSDFNKLVYLFIDTDPSRDVAFYGNPTVPGLASYVLSARHTMKGYVGLRCLNSRKAKAMDICNIKFTTCNV